MEVTHRTALAACWALACLVALSGAEASRGGDVELIRAVEIEPVSAPSGRAEGEEEAVDEAEQPRKRGLAAPVPNYVEAPYAPSYAPSHLAAHVVPAPVAAPIAPVGPAIAPVGAHLQPVAHVAPAVVSQTVEVEKQIPVPYIRYVGVQIPHPVAVPVPHPVAVPIPQPYPVHVAVPQAVPVPVVKTITIPVEKPVPVKVEKHVPYPVDRPVPYPVEKHIPVPVIKHIPVHIPIIKTIHHYPKKGWH